MRVCVLERCEWRACAWAPQVTGLRGHIIDPFGGEMTAGKEAAALESAVYETAIRKFRGINTSILLHLWARWALKAQLILSSPPPSLLPAAANRPFQLAVNASCSGFNAETAPRFRLSPRASVKKPRIIPESVFYQRRRGLTPPRHAPTRWLLWALPLRWRSASLKVKGQRCPDF